MTVLLLYIGFGTLLTLEEAGVFLLPGDISLVAAGLHASPHPMYLLLSWISGSAGMVLGASLLFHGVQRSGSFTGSLSLLFFAIFFVWYRLRITGHLRPAPAVTPSNLG